MPKSLLSLLFAIVVQNAAAADAIKVSKVRLQLPSASIAAEVFEPAASGPHPVVLVLHGAGGTLLDGPEMRRVARALATDGNAVYLPHYFERTGTLFALDSTMQRNFATWLATVRESVVAVQAARNDRSPIGIFGYSLGAFLALQTASDNPRVAAVVEHAGGVWNNRIENIQRMPAVLMVHGEQDRRVPFAKYAQPLLRHLRNRATTLETHFFPDEGHGFGPAALIAVRADAVKFFRQHLRTQ